MNAINIEIKARCTDSNHIREVLKSREARYIGTDHQIDTYFKVPQGRMKLREGSIENALIYYLRDNQQGPKTSKVKLFKTAADTSLGEVLTTALDVLVVVDKQREIYFIDNVKFHIDSVKQLGSFVEIEAIDSDGSRSLVQLQEQCDIFLELFKIDPENLVAVSYSDLLIDMQHEN